MTIQNAFFSAVTAGALSIAASAPALARVAPTIPDHFQDRYGAQNSDVKSYKCDQSSGLKRLFRDGTLYERDISEGDNFAVRVKPRSGGDSTIEMEWNFGLSGKPAPC